MLRSWLKICAEHGVERAVRLGLEHVLLRGSTASGRTKRLYWAVAPEYYPRRYPIACRGQPAAPDPFKLESVDPTRITRFTARCYPPWWQRRELFGSVQGGEWDRRSHDEAPVFGGPPQCLFVGDPVTDTPLFRALKRHFDDGVPWVETQFVTAVIDRLEDGEQHVWHECRDQTDVLDRCERLDAIYSSMKRQGCRSYRDRTSPQDRPGDFIDAMEREIVVDIGRDGQLLLVSGKHRVYLARLLRLETIPVAFLVRHAEWMQTRRRTLAGDRNCDHPDLRGLQSRTDKAGVTG